MRLLVTGFGPFGEFDTNPSAALAEGCGLPFRILEVSFDAVEAFLAALDPTSFDALLMLGVAGKAEAFLVETTARNHIGNAPDVRGVVQGPGPIDPAGPPQLAATLWTAELLVEVPKRAASVDAGDFLCNYAFYRALQAFPDKRTGFLHVPPVTAVPLDEQHAVVRGLVEALA